MAADFQLLFNIMLGIALAGTGWWAREMWGAMKELRKDLQSLEVNLPTRYVAKEDFRTALQEVKILLNKISDKLDEKADKK